MRCFSRINDHVPDRLRKESSAGGDGVLKVRFTHVVAESTPKGKAVLKFKELVEEKSNGKIEVLVFPASQLYGDKEELEQLMANNVQFIAPSVTKLGGFLNRLSRLWTCPSCLMTTRLPMIFTMVPLAKS